MNLTEEEEEEKKKEIKQRRNLTWRGVRARWEWEVKNNKEIEEGITWK